MNSRHKIAGLLAVLVVGLGCSLVAERHEARIPEDVREVTEQFVARLQARDSDGLEALLSSEAWTAESRDTLRLLANSLPADAEYEIKRGAFLAEIQQGVGSYQTAIQLGIAGKYYYLAFALRRDLDGLRIIDLNVQPAAFDLEQINRFNVSGKPPLMLLVFLLSLAVPLFVVWCLVDCWRRRPPGKWLWLVVILVCTPSFVMNWTIGVGTVFIEPLVLLGRAFMKSQDLFPWALLGSGFSQSGPIEPMILGVALPIGAIAWYLTARLRGRTSQSEDVPEPPAPVAGEDGAA